MEEELELLEEEAVVLVVEELQEEEVVVQVEEVLEEVVEVRMSPSMSAALWECDRQRALMGSRPSCRRHDVETLIFCFRFQVERFVNTYEIIYYFTRVIYHLLGRLIRGSGQTPAGPLR